MVFIAFAQQFSSLSVYFLVHWYLPPSQRVLLLGYQGQYAEQGPRCLGGKKAVGMLEQLKR